MTQQQSPQYAAPTQAPPAWYHGSVLIGLSLLCCWPLGLILLWTSPRASTGIKLAGTGLAAVLGIIGVAAVVAGAGKSRGAGAETRGASPSQPAPQLVTESCLELASKFGASSGLSDLQKEELWKTYEGKGFEWDMEITEVSSGMLNGFNIQAKCSPESRSLVQDVIISYPNDAKSFVLGLQKGQTYKLRGTLKRTSTLLGLSARGAF